MRLDLVLIEKSLCTSRSKASELIRSGAVSVDGRTVLKPSFQVDINQDITCQNTDICKYVSRGGLKLEAALEYFKISPEGLICIDVGASTGGFTDCLLQKNAKKIYAIDSGSLQLNEKIKKDARVISIENFNAKFLDFEVIGELCDIAVMDVSFISQTKLYFGLSSVMKKEGFFISLIKPQFEVGRHGIGKGGIVKDEKLRAKAVSEVIEAAALFGFECIGTIESPIKGGDGNVEYLACFKYIR